MGGCRRPDLDRGSIAGFVSSGIPVDVKGTMPRSRDRHSPVVVLLIKIFAVRIDLFVYRLEFRVAVPPSGYGRSAATTGTHFL